MKIFIRFIWNNSDIKVATKLMKNKSAINNYEFVNYLFLVSLVFMNKSK